MALDIKTAVELDAVSFVAVQNETPFTRLDRGSAVRSILQTFNRRLAENYDALRFNFFQAFPSRAVGVFLDHWASVFGIARLDRVRAGAHALDKNIRFFVDSGTLQGLIGGTRIPAGTNISTVDGEIVYTVLEDAPFQPADTEVFVTAIAAKEGLGHNVGNNVLTVHDLRNPDLKVTNDKQIAEGRDPEEDENLRFRISLAARGVTGGNEDAILLTALGLPGVANARVIHLANGVNTVSVMLIPIGNRVTESVLRLARLALGAVAPAGTLVNVFEPQYKPWFLTAVMEFLDGTSNVRKDQIRRQAEAVVLDFAAATGLGGTFQLALAYRAILSSFTDLLNIQTICLCIDGEQLVTQEFRLGEDELLVPDPEVDKTVRFT